MRLIGVCRFVLLLAFAAVPARADQIAVGTSAGGIYLVDTVTGAEELVLETIQFFDIAADSAGQIYGITGNRDLYLVDLASGSRKRIGNTGVFVNALTFHGSGRLIGAGGDRIMEIDTATARPAELMRVRGFDSSGDVTATADGVLYATSREGGGDALWRIEPVQGAAVRIGPIGYRNVYGLVPTDGALTGTTEANELIRIDVQTGAGRFVAPLRLRGGSYGATLMELISAGLDGVGVRTR